MSFYRLALLMKPPVNAQANIASDPLDAGAVVALQKPLLASQRQVVY